MNIYARIEELAKEKGLSFSFISEKLDKNRNYLSHCVKQNTKLTLDVIDKIAELLGTTVDYLVGDTDIKKDTPIQLDRRTKKLIKIYDSLTTEQQALIDSMIDHFARVEGFSSDDDD